MIDLETIEREINKLEATRDTTYATCERLSWLYVCRDHLMPQATNDRRTPAMQGSEFLELASGVPYDHLMILLDDHLEAIRLLYPKSYDSLMDRIRELR